MENSPIDVPGGIEFAGEPGLVDMFEEEAMEGTGAAFDSSLIPHKETSTPINDASHVEVPQAQPDMIQVQAHSLQGAQTAVSETYTTNSFSIIQNDSNSEQAGNIIFPQDSSSLDEAVAGQFKICQSHSQNIIGSKKWVSEANNNNQNNVWPALTTQKAVKSVEQVEHSYGGGCQDLAANIEDNQKHISYSRMLAPPGVRPASTGASPECGIVVERLTGFSLDSYAWAVTAVVGKAAITYIGRDPRDDMYILVFLKSSNLVDLIVSKGIWLRGKWMNVSHFQQPAARLIISGVLPFIPDSLVIEAIAPFGESVYPILRKIPAAVRNAQFKGACSFRRELYLVKKHKELTLPETIEVLFLGVKYSLGVSTEGPRCYACGSLQHTVTNCKQKGENEISTMLVHSKIQEDSGHDTTKLVKNNVLNAQSNVSIGAAADKMMESKTLASAEQDDYFKGKVRTRNYFSQCNLSSLPPLKVPASDYGKVKKKMIISCSEETKELENMSLTTLGETTNVVQMVGCTGDGINHPQKPLEGKKDSIGFCPPAGCVVPVFGGEEDESIAPIKKKVKKLMFGELVPEFKDMQIVDEVLQEDSFHIMVDHSRVVSTGEHKDSGRLQKTKESEVKQNGKGGPQIDNDKTKQVANKVGKCSNQGIQAIEEWCARAKFLKEHPRKKLAVEFFNRYPGLVKEMEWALEAPKLFRPLSPKFKKVQDFLSDIKSMTDGPRNLRVAKRKQDMGAETPVGHSNEKNK